MKPDINYPLSKKTYGDFIYSLSPRMQVLLQVLRNWKIVCIIPIRMSSVVNYLASYYNVDR